jgi:hypothetical protein
MGTSSTARHRADPAAAHCEDVNEQQSEQARTKAQPGGEALGRIVALGAWGR